jgi:very-short-patch-repair endonuclease
VLGLPLDARIEVDHTRSELERLFLQLCRRYGLPMPQVNARVGPYLVDFLWREQRLIVETDGYRYHRGRQAFEDDRERGLELRMRGFDVLRLGHRQVVEAPVDVIALLASALSASGGSTPPRASLGFPTD